MTTESHSSRPPHLAGLDLLASAVIVLDADGRISYANAAAENLLESSLKALSRQKLTALFLNPDELAGICAQALEHKFSDLRQDLNLERLGREPLRVHSIISALDGPSDNILIELRENVQQLKLDREERILDQSQVNKELIRNLAHEIKNPLGGIRGAAQLLELELPALHLSELREYTQVIIKEADRLQTLVDRLLAPHRRPHIVGDVNIHEVCERVRSLIMAEFPTGLTILRDYDASIPEFRGDKEQLIQTVLNIAHNAAQALSERIEAGDAELIFKTRVARQVTLAKVRYGLALDLHIIDNGPGIAPQIRDRIFYPLVSGREGGSGLGLTLAQTFVQQHLGVIECESRPGYTDFRIVLPLP
ncbi:MULTISPECIES: nitrogen regulation protein NR(II) [unclassified Janthinobacterium]|jgi:two-component system, NtrC family, nitrogen regulation sensor histidine kinase GlnL|uniref:nitrogen regulation protein NR(II) n=1 Tax=unclassified Janthinobacterium TaxID=2610881 RepID=UPI001615193A|nr:MULTISPECIES: nitrogen regulation protein NR(II) [unclassified Janthinobacterium]MBB5606704.1 two-component system nitrogen regulation sensor histidine kinase GlnL [Janthinobacterium sp. S3T4]MBB5612246.1 two-component system nitrogen regulation sensor histidine kinase GlnL [Janthinobacterium sp. S3M3]